jgi:hypothetical protein
MAVLGGPPNGLRISRRRLAPDHVAGQARHPHRYIAGRTRPQARLLRQETRRKRQDTLERGAVAGRLHARVGRTMTWRC